MGASPREIHVKQNTCRSPVMCLARRKQNPGGCLPYTQLNGRMCLPAVLRGPVSEGSGDLESS